MDGRLERAVIDSFPSFFRGKRILVTGDTGFKGSWLSLWLHDLGAQVVGVALPASETRAHFVLLDLGRFIRHVDGDIRDLPALLKLFHDVRPEVVFHLAAQALVRRAYTDPKTTFDTNLGGSVNLLEAVRQTPSVRALVYITSDKCYLNKELARGYDETDELGGHDPYSASKACAEMAMAAYAASFLGHRTLGVASARAGNVIGGGDWSEDRLVPDCMKALMRGDPIVLRNPDAVRPWQHVLEPLTGYLMLAVKLFEETGAWGGAWNFGPLPDASCTVGDLCRRILVAWGEGSIRVERPLNMPHEDQLLYLNADKARLKLGWQPRWSVDRTVTETVAWYRAVTTGRSAIEVTRAQIAQYMDGNGAE